jgi:hypothetical protein
VEEGRELEIIQKKNAKAKVVISGLDNTCLKANLRRKPTDREWLSFIRRGFTDQEDFTNSGFWETKDITANDNFIFVSKTSDSAPTGGVVVIYDRKTLKPVSA